MTAAAAPEGTDPRREALLPWMADTSWDQMVRDVGRALTDLDAADRAAGYMRIKADAETVEKVAEVLARVFGGAPATSHVWRHDARAVLEALTNV